jgi:hypothetical protein
MNTENKTDTSTLAVSTKIASYLIILITAALLAISLYCGWRANGVITGQLMAKKTLDVICDPVFQVKISKWCYLQFQFFFGAILVFGLMFVCKLFSSFRMEEIKSKGFLITVFFITIILGVLASQFGSSYYRYNQTLKTVIEKQKKNKISVPGQQQFSETFLKELVTALRDVTKLLINWAVLLLTGLGYIIFRIMKFTE